MRWFRFLVIAVLAVLVQVGAVGALGRRGARPDLLVALLVPVALGMRMAQGFAAGALLGLGRDVFSVEPFGLGIGAFALLGCVVARLRPGVFASHPVVHGFLGFLAAVAASLVSAVAVAGEGGPSLSAVVGGALWSGLGTGLLTVGVGWVVWRHARWLGLRRRTEFEHV